MSDTGTGRVLGELEVRLCEAWLARIREKTRDWMAWGQHLSRMRAIGVTAKHLEYRTQLDGECGSKCEWGWRPECGGFF